MNNKRQPFGGAIIPFGIVLTLAATFVAVSGPSQSGRAAMAAPPAYDLSWHTIDGGGVMFSAGDDYELSGTIGQPDASNVMEGGNFELTGGFWFRIPPGDCEDDGDVDLNDFEAFEGCLTGPGLPGVIGECLCFDVDRNNVIDLADLAVVQANFTSQ